MDEPQMKYVQLTQGADYFLEHMVVPFLHVVKHRFRLFSHVVICKLLFYYNSIITLMLTVDFEYNWMFEANYIHMQFSFSGNCHFLVLAASLAY